MLFRSPATIREMNWAEQESGPLHLLGSTSREVRPGSSCQTGVKLFDLIEPTDENLLLYQRWQKLSEDQRDRGFFGSLVERCMQCRVVAGEMIVVAVEMVHVVYIPEDSVCFSGSFLQIWC